MAIRVMKFGCVPSKEQRERWKQLADLVQQATNRIWREWLVWHVSRGNDRTIRQFMADYTAWVKAGKVGERPKCDIKAVPPELSKAIYATLAEQFPTLNSRVRVLLQNVVQQKIVSRKAANGSWSGWFAILTDRESLPSSTRAQPILFDKKVCKLIQPENADGDWRIVLRIDREENDEGRGVSTVDEVQLITKGRRCRTARAIIERCHSGEYKFAGSSLACQDGKWFVLLCYGLPEREKPELGSATAVLRGGRYGAFRLRFDWGSTRRGPSVDMVAAVRLKTNYERRSRQENYRWVGTSTKGHGADRALAGVFKLSRRWTEFVKRVNHETSRRIVDECVERRIGRLVYVQPVGGRGDSRALQFAGKRREQRDSSGWEWAQLAALLNHKCQEAGIHLEVRKSEPEKARKPGDRSVSSVRKANQRVRKQGAAASMVS